MLADTTITLLFFSSLGAVRMGALATQYLEHFKVPDGVFMKYGVYIQICGLMALGLLYLVSHDELCLHFLTTLTLAGTAVYTMGALTVFKAMPKARVAFGALALGIQASIVLFAAASTFALA
ncbi:MAG TPA: hypothetical protein VGP72_24735 [Planctomycetota bacterium]|jgi:hypothetical protein